MLFSKRLTPAPPLVLCLEATIQGQGPSFQAELIPVRSPLLRESYLVPFPPLTYMLKFSGFADLTSCCAWEKVLIGKPQESATEVHPIKKMMREASSQVAETEALFKNSCMCHSLHPEGAAMAHKDADTERPCLHEGSTSTEAGILPGISRECNARSRIHWFTEFCNSQ